MTNNMKGSCSVLSLLSAHHESLSWRQYSTTAVLCAVMCRAVGCVCIACARARPVAHQHTGVSLGLGDVQTPPPVGTAEGEAGMQTALLPHVQPANLGNVRCTLPAPQVLPPTVDVDRLPLGSNTLLVPQVDYNDVLGHPNARVFVSHCGLHSVYEAAYHGVPVVGVPFMFEQVRHLNSNLSLNRICGGSARLAVNLCSSSSRLHCCQCAARPA